MEDMAWLEQRFRTLKAVHPEAKLQIEGGFNRPPLMRTDLVISLYEEAVQLANLFDYPVREYWTGGASDGNFTGAMGIPTLDGLGAEGAGAHAPNEQVRISSLPKRANLLYHLIRKKLSSVSAPVST
jgi:glutamate carboxypeptidase